MLPVLRTGAVMAMVSGVDRTGAVMAMVSGVDSTGAVMAMVSGVDRAVFSGVPNTPMYRARIRNISFS